MASAGQERQIKPIYDAIDAGQFKLALQTCTKLLKKQPKFELAKALKALALVRMGKIDEGMTACDEVLATKPTDELLLGAMAHVLRALSRHDDMVFMFEGAYKKYPLNDELGAQAFMANVRLGNWKAAQQLATRLHKNSKEDRFLYWNIMCVILQASELSTPQQTQPILQKLALRLVATCPVPSSASPDRFYLHLSLLRDLEQYDEALQLLDSEVARALCDTSLQLEDLRHTIAMAAGRKEIEYNLAKDRLVERRDRNWLTFLKFINCAIERIEEDGALSEARSVLERLAEEDGSSERGSFLAILDLENRIRLAHPNTPKVPFVDILQRYFRTFSGKLSCFDDLKQFVGLEGAELAQWRAFLEAEDVSGSPSSISEVNHHINTFKLQRWDLKAEEITVELEEALAKKYLRAYVAALPLGKNLAKTELQPADDLAILATSSFISLHLLTRSRSYLSCAVSVLEFALVRSPQGFQHRLLLIRLYRLLGAPSVALEHYRKLNIKQVQQDTMVHFILGRCFTFSLAAVGDLTYLQECLDSTQIYTSNTSETPDMVIKAFQYEKYTQVPEFIEFEDRLDNSIQRDLTKMEHVRMRLTHEPANVETVDTELVELKFLYERSATQFDNRDFSVLPEYQPRGQSIDLQTAMGGNSPGGGWLHTWMKMYILAFQLASDLDPALDGHTLLGEKFKTLVPAGTGVPLDVRIRQISDEEAKELTEDETRLRSFAMGLMLWLEPHHQYSRPPPKPLPESSASVMQSLSASTVTSIPNSTMPTGQTSTPPAADMESPASVDPPTEVTEFFDSMESSFKQSLIEQLPWHAMHIATLAQEGLILFNIVTARFRLGGGSKMKKSDPMMHSIKSLREKAVTVLRSLGTQLIKSGETDATMEGRRAFVEESKQARVVPEISHDFCLDVAKKVTDSRKKVKEGLGKGFERLCKIQGQGLSISS